ncbi:MAG: hypothetical protein IKN75_08745 [Prevotella sp.]|nr:hypothetical protein [Prevotella sp.]
MNAVSLNNLWNYLQGLSLSASNQRWLGERLIEAAREDEDSKKVRQQEAMVKDTLTRAFEELHAGEVYDDARSLFND